MNTILEEQDSKVDKNTNSCLQTALRPIQRR